MNDTQNTIFRPLDFLKKRPIPIKKQDIFIKFKEKDKPDIAGNGKRITLNP